jgi:hypothetical protein
MDSPRVSRLFVWMALTASGLLACEPLCGRGRGLWTPGTGVLVFLLVGMGALGLLSKLPRAPGVR